MSEIYTSKFYDSQAEGSSRSARLIVPIIADAIKPTSVIDIGCGVGHWLSEFRRAGATTVTGVDGPWALDDLKIDKTDFVQYDFVGSRAPFKPPTPLQRYDLLTSFEFVEHIDENRADALIDYFCATADSIVVSAAVPDQGGTNHVNERWPDYWAAKFAAHGYVACDFIRPIAWRMPDIEPWYIQNSIGYFKDSVPAAIMTSAEEAWKQVWNQPLPIVHPAMFRIAAQPWVRPSLPLRAARKIKRTFGL